jgi:hypothetical protein
MKIGSARAAARVLRESMYEWANDTKEQIDMCVLEVLCILDGVDDALMARVLKRRGWYLVPDDSYPSLQAYIDASYAALAADVRPRRGRPLQESPR